MNELHTSKQQTIHLVDNVPINLSFSMQQLKVNTTETEK